MLTADAPCLCLLNCAVRRAGLFCFEMSVVKRNCLLCPGPVCCECE